MGHEEEERSSTGQRVGRPSFLTISQLESVRDYAWLSSIFSSN
jgi:hypothetical protein